jgi:hypothetical protein
MSTMMRGVGVHGLPQVRRVEAKLEVPPEPEPDRRTQLQKNVDFRFDLLMKKEAQEREEHKKRVAQVLAKQQQQQAEQDRKLKVGAYLTAELQVEQTFAVYGIQPADQKRIEDRITQLGLWARPSEAIEFAVGESMKIVAERPQPRVIPYGYAEVGEDD